MNEQVDRQVASDGDRVAPPFERRYTVAQVAALAGVSPKAVYADIQRGALKARRKRHATKGYMVVESELRRWLDEEFEEVPVA